jgi:hypothetical protein
MATEDVINTILVIAPGFVALKVFQLVGAQRKRSEWEWTIWSIIAGVLIAAGTALARLNFGVEVPELKLAEGDPSAGSPATKLSFVGLPERTVVAVGAGVLGAIVWRLIRQARGPLARRGVMQLTDSAWDYVLDEAVNNKFGIEVVTPGAGDAELRFYGIPGTFAYESAEAEPLLYLRKVHEWTDASGYTKVLGTDGILLHRDNIKRIRVVSKATGVRVVRAGDGGRRRPDPESRTGGAATGMTVARRSRSHAPIDADVQSAGQATVPDKRSAAAGGPSNKAPLTA